MTTKTTSELTAGDVVIWGGTELTVTDVVASGLTWAPAHVKVIVFGGARIVSSGTDEWTLKQDHHESAVDTCRNCSKCGGFCPSGVLDNGLCLDCDLIGKNISVYWGQWGLVSCQVTHVSKNHTIYAKRWMKTPGRWSSPRPVHYYKGWQLTGKERYIP